MLYTDNKLVEIHRMKNNNGVQARLVKYLDPLCAQICTDFPILLILVVNKILFVKVLTPHPLCDPTEFGSLADLYGIYGRDGYLGGLRLLQVLI